VQGLKDEQMSKSLKRVKSALADARLAVEILEPLGRADAAYVHAVTGFAIGGVAPVALLTAPRAFWDQLLSKFAII
jgi:prolyl-tRNA editing enzyme YbaK/EbsC (Cys-tRNA(Pro) deacylase)